jgi:hypothetical protein
MQKLSAKWVPKCLNSDQKHRSFHSFEQLLELFSFGAILLISCLSWWPWTKPGYITMTRRQINKSMEWRHSGSPHHATPKFRVQISTGKVFASFICDGSRRHPPHKFLYKVKIISAECYLSLLLQDILKEIRRAVEGHKGSYFHSLSTCNQDETGLPGLLLC